MLTAQVIYVSASNPDAVGAAVCTWRWSVRGSKVFAASQRRLDAPLLALPVPGSDCLALPTASSPCLLSNLVEDSVVAFCSCVHHK